MEWLYHLGVPEEQIEELAEHSANTVPCDDALYRRVLHAPRLRRPARRSCPTAA